MALRVCRIFTDFIEDFRSRRHCTLDCGVHVMGFVQELKLQQRGFTDEVFGALGIFYPGKLNEQAFFSLKADIRLADPELVDPVSNGFKGLFHGHFLDTSRFLVRQIQGYG